MIDSPALAQRPHQRPTFAPGVTQLAVCTARCINYVEAGCGTDFWGTKIEDDYAFA